MSDKWEQLRADVERCLLIRAKDVRALLAERDALLGALDLGQHIGLKAQVTDLKPESWANPDSPASVHLWLNCLLVLFSIDVVDGAWSKQGSYELLISAFLLADEILGYDIMAAAYEKIEYNRTRQDHKRENRAKENGKKF